MQGTRDPAAWLAVPDAIRYQAERDWHEVRDRCCRLAHGARRALCDLLGTEALAPEAMIAQMAAVRRPRSTADLSMRLFTRHRIEVPVDGLAGDLLRVSVAG
jgi:isopenicillin-N epimerase